MVNFFKKHFIVSILVGIFLGVAGILMIIKGDPRIYFNELDKETSGYIDCVELFSGLIMILLSLYILWPLYKVSKQGKMKNILLFEYLMILIVSIVGFLLPALTSLFGASNRVDLLSKIGLGNKDVSFWLGVVLYIIGTVEVIISNFNEKKNLPRVIFLGIGFLTLGCWLIFGNFQIKDIIAQVAAWSFAVIGVILTFSGIVVWIGRANSGETGDKPKKQTADKEEKTEQIENSPVPKKEKPEKKEKPKKEKKVKPSSTDL